uniref:VLIG-type G domain-containing protein n=1 Tax=Poecilia reticulata TaxID=8081 RepID=A0A3P9PL18_POERE
MHEDFIQENDPYWCLQKNKRKFCTDFKDVFHERDQCQKKAEEFTNQSLKPAVEDFICRSLGLDIVDKMLIREEFSTRMSFQYSILLDLISKSDFKCFLSYICSYDDYVKSWISDRIRQIFSSGSTVCEFEDKYLKCCIDHINAAINKAKAENTISLRTFFAHWLNGCVEEMTEALRVEFKNIKFDSKLSHLYVKPQNELFTKVVGCGKQCPFCKIPCDAGGEAHTQHFGSLHRPEGLGQFRWEHSKKLMTDICSSLVISDMRFRCSATKGEWHYYKKYREIYPNWNIAPDVSLEASDYWKYVMATYNEEFAQEYDAEPGDIPEAWKKITEKRAKESLKESFNIK